MRKTVLLSMLGLAAVGAAQAQEVGRVLSSTPVIQQVAVPRQVCTNQQVAVEQPNSGAGGIMGAIAGGAIGNQIGGGSGRGVATVLGVLGGAVLGNRIEGSGSQLQTVQQCNTQTFYENRAVSYNVVYEYNGKQYTVNMPSDPGPTVQLQVTPVTTTVPVQPQAPQSAQPGAPMVQAPAQVQTIVTTVPTAVVVPASYPYYYAPRPYYYPPVSLSIGYVHGWGGHHHGHWR